MSEYTISQIRPDDRRAQEQMDRLLRRQGIQRDRNLDYSLGVYDQDYRLAATGSCYGNTLRCFAVDPGHTGQGLMEQLVSALVEYEIGQGRRHLYVYTKCSTAKYFRDLGFYDIVTVDGAVSFLENRRGGFQAYLDRLALQAQPGTDSCAVVMNANPFTLGHQYLVETAAAQFPQVHVFVVSDDSSLVPFAVRRRLVEEGCDHLGSVHVHDSGDYIISSATFPSYFQRDEEAVIRSHARLDGHIFLSIARCMGVSCRLLGEEPFSTVTALYNQELSAILPPNGVECRIVPRREVGGQAVSASAVRQAIHDGQLEQIRSWVPQSTYRYFASAEGAEVVRAIQESGAVRHY